jgi:hypothetical protein
VLEKRVLLLEDRLLEENLAARHWRRLEEFYLEPID